MSLPPFASSTLVLLAAAWAAPFASAQADDTNSVVVTAARAPQRLADTLAHTTVLTRADIERSLAIDLPSLLATEAGVQFAANGGPGTATALFVRGAPTRQVLVLIDGVPQSRQDATGQVGIEHLMLDQVERVEVVRGNVSALYGGGAVGGVIQVFTRRGGRPQAGALLEVGSRGLLHGSAQASNTFGSTRLSLGVSGQRSAGYSALDVAQVPVANPDRDGYRNASATFNLSQTVADGHTLALGWVYSEGRLDYDSAFATPADQQSSRTVKNQWRLASDDRLAERWTSRLVLSNQRDDASYRESGDFGFSGQYQTDVASLNWVNEIKVSERTSLSAGIDLQRQRIQADDGFGGLYDPSRNVVAVFGGIQTRLGEHELALNLRYDDVEGLDPRTTGSLGWGWRLAPPWTLVARLANAFSAPPLGYLYAPYFGNPALRAETSTSGEVGLQWSTEQQRLRATLFQTQVDDEIEYDPATLSFGNIARTRNRGLEASYIARWSATDLRASLTLQRPIDENTGQQRLRRSQTMASVSATHELDQGWRLGLTARYASQRPDVGGIELPAYTVVDLTAQWNFSPAGQGFARLENVGNVAYETAKGYQQPPRGLFVGLRWRTDL
jgi:vitamin B12 transporter